MNELSYQDCIPLIEALQKGIRTIGILKAVNEFGEADSNPVNLRARLFGDNKSCIPGHSGKSCFLLPTANGEDDAA